MLPPCVDAGRKYVFMWTECPHCDRHMNREPRWDLMGLDSPSKGGVAMGQGRGHSMETQHVTRGLQSNAYNDRGCVSTAKMTQAEGNWSEGRQGAAEGWAPVSASQRRVGLCWVSRPLLPQMFWASFDRLRSCTLSGETSVFDLFVVLLNLFQGNRGRGSGGEGKRAA